MTDRVQALTVALEQDIREDDVESVVAAIGQMRGVAGVKANVVDVSAYVARARAKSGLVEKILALIMEDGDL